MRLFIPAAWKGFLFLLFAVSIVSINWSLARNAIDVTNNEYANMTCDGVVDDASRLQALIDATPKHVETVLSIPPGRTCAFNGRIFLRDDLTFKFSDGAVFAGGSWVYVSRSKNKGDGPRNVNWINCKFISNDRFVTRTHILIRARNVKFKNCLWDRVFRMGTHVIDIGGSSDVYIDGNYFIGSYGDISKAKNNSKEAIQADYAWKLGMTVSEEDLLRAGTDLSVYDNSPSKNIVVRNSYFIPSYRADGSVESFPPPPFGIHAVTPECLKNSDMCIGSLKFENNYVLDILDMGSRRANFGLLHFRLQGPIVISGNIFEGVESSNEYILSIQVPAGRSGEIDVDFRGNRFVGLMPRSALALIKEEGLTEIEKNPQGRVRICDNDFYIPRGQPHPRIMGVAKLDTKGGNLDCQNRVRPLAEAPSRRLR